NATNNDTIVEAFARLCKEKCVEFSCSDGRMRCMPHTIHISALKVQDRGSYSRTHSLTN
ncbi:hypothetical protein B0H13DRAFT_1610153, partial [Mycena leptocephala]